MWSLECGCGYLHSNLKTQNNISTGVQNVVEYCEEYCRALHHRIAWGWEECLPREQLEAAKPLPSPLLSDAHAQAFQDHDNHDYLDNCDDHGDLDNHDYHDYLKDHGASSGKENQDNHNSQAYISSKVSPLPYFKKPTNKSFLYEIDNVDLTLYDNHDDHDHNVQCTSLSILGEPLSLNPPLPAFSFQDRDKIIIMIIVA